MLKDLVLAGLGLISGIKEEATLLTESSFTVDPVWKNKVSTGPATAQVIDLYVVESTIEEVVEKTGIDLANVIEFLVFVPVANGQHIKRADGTSYQIFEVEELPGVSKEMYLGKARKVMTGKET